MFSIEMAPEYANEFVKSAEKVEGITFDFSVDSLGDLEISLDRLFQRGFDPNKYERFVLIASCYLGEIIVRQLNAKWIDGTKVETKKEPPEGMMQPLMVKCGTVFLNPYQRVINRLENGEEDNVCDYFNSLTHIAEIEGVQKAPEIRAGRRVKKSSGLFSRLFGL